MTREENRKPPPPTDWTERFLKAFAKSGNISQAARTAKVTRQGVQQRRLSDQSFADAMAEAQEEATDALEMEARRRAETGTLKPVFYQGVEVGKVREFSDTLMVVLLKANRPDKYRENSRIEHDFTALSDDDLIREAAGLIAGAAAAGPDGDGGAAGE